VIQPDTATTDSDFETIHCERSFDSNMLFPKYHTEALEATILHLQNLTAILIDNINKAVEEAMAKSHSDNKIVQDYLKDLGNIKKSETNITSTNNVFIIVLTLIAIQSCYCMFKICFTSLNNIKPLFRLADWKITEMEHMRFKTTQKQQKYSKKMNKYPQVGKTGVDAVHGSCPQMV
jgi:hypothetical protein